MSEQFSSPIWYPCAQMKDYESFPILDVVSAQGGFLKMRSGEQVFDAISSWWCKSLGHGHPALKQALIEQADKLEHIILANTTHEAVDKLSNQLCALTPHLNKVFYACDGASAVEIAVKMSLHAQRLSGQTQRTHLMALSQGYHGDTLLASALGECELFRHDYASLMGHVHHLTGIPYVQGKTDPLWSDCSAVWPHLEVQLEAQKDHLAAIVLEPIVQGAGGMLIYSQDFLKRLSAWAQAQGIHVIADEIMTGFGRTGKMLACEHADIQPDFVCLGKGLTAGWLPMSAVLTTQAVYDVFYDDYGTGRAFIHSHTYGGNALAAAVAVEAMNVLEQDNIISHVSSLETAMLDRMQAVADDLGCLVNVRGIGGIVAADLEADDDSERLGYAVYQEAVNQGLLLRPLGNTLYWLPPLNTSLAEVELLAALTKASIAKALPSQAKVA